MAVVSRKGRIPRHLIRLPQNRFREKREKVASPKNGRILRDARYPRECKDGLRNGLSHFNACHPLPVVEDVLAALADWVTVAAVERLGRQRGVRLQIGGALFTRG